jgi:hypothetical protein
MVKQLLGRVVVPLARVRLLRSGAATAADQRHIQAAAIQPWHRWSGNFEAMEQSLD